MSLLHYFLSPDGRIPGWRIWLGLVVLMAISVPISAMLDPEAESRQGTRTTGDRPPSLGNTIWNLLLTWPSAAISIKRFNDRDRPRWLGYLLALLMVVLVVANHWASFSIPTMGPPEKLAFLACSCSSCGR